MKTKILKLSLLIAVVVTVLSGFVLEQEQKALADKLIRMHVVANSDTEADQTLKRNVRDAVLDDAKVLLAGVADRETATSVLDHNMEQLEKTAKTEIKRQGYSYDVTVSLAEESFPTREYPTFSLPAGRYTALRVTIGAGAGHNWWCVVFPPVCTEAAIDDAAATMQLSAEEMALITEDGAGYVIKFRLLELLEELRAVFSSERI